MVPQNNTPKCTQVMKILVPYPDKTMAHPGSRKALDITFLFFFFSFSFLWMSFSLSFYLLYSLALTPLVDILGPELSVARAPKHWNPNSRGRRGMNIATSKTQAINPFR